MKAVAAGALGGVLWACLMVKPCKGSSSACVVKLGAQTVVRVCHGVGCELWSGNQ